MSTAATAIRFLKTRVMSAGDALRQLEGITEPLRMIALFQKYFPAEFAKQEIRWMDQRALVEACCEFVGLVSLRFFPCYENMDMWDMEEREGSFYMRDIYFEAPWPEWYGDGNDDFTTLQTAVLSANGRIKWDGHEYQPVYNVAAYPEINDAYLTRLCAGKRTPLRHLPLAVRFVEKNTNNFWCDLTQEQCDCAQDWPEWSEENIKLFTKEWKEATAIAAKVALLEGWLLEKPERKAEVESLLKRATKKLPPRLRVGTISSQAFLEGDQDRPLIEQMDEWLEGEDE